MIKLLILCGMSICLNATAATKIDKNDLAPFLDGVIETSMKVHHVPGVVVTVVQNDQVIFSKGCGC